MALPEIPKSLSRASIQLRAGIFLHFISFSKISHRKFHSFHLKHQLNEKYPTLEKKVKILVLEQPRRSDGTRNTHVPIETISSWELGAKGNAGNFPSGIFSCPSKGSHPSDPAYWKTVNYSQSSTKGVWSHPGAPSREEHARAWMGFNGARKGRNSKFHKFRSSLRLGLRPKRSFQFQDHQKRSWRLWGSVMWFGGLGLRFCGVNTQQKPCIWWFQGLSQPQEDFPDFLRRCSRKSQPPGGSWGF